MEEEEEEEEEEQVAGAVAVAEADVSSCNRSSFISISSASMIDDEEDE